MEQFNPPYTVSNRDSLTIAARVARGAALLDAHKPGWHRQIDPEFLDLSSCSECVLGQLFGAFEDGVAALGISVDFTLQEEAQHGFDIRCHEGRAVYDELHAEWLRVITKRQAVA